MSVGGRMYSGLARAGRRRALRTLAALVSAAIPLAYGKTSPSSGTGTQGRSSGGRRITDMIGANGWAGASRDVEMWRQMGISWGRDSVGPGQPDSPTEPVRVDKTGSQFDNDLAPALLLNNRNGIKSLLLLGYTAPWNATVPGDSNSAPRDVRAWTRYVEAAVRKYSAPPFNLRYFQIWNEAAGKLSGGAQQATFWHGPNFSKDDRKVKPYERAMQDYVERVHLPAARIIRKYNAYVVYGGWPDQGGLSNYYKWLEYRSPASNERMLDWVDYLDTHYLGVSDIDQLYERYVKNGPARGIWQTEIGDAYMKDPHYLPEYFFDFAVWALDHNWDDPNKYVSMIYHWDGYEPFRLTHRGPPTRTYNVSGRSLVVLCHTVSGPLASLPNALKFGPGASGGGLRSGNDVVLQVKAAAGERSVALAGLRRPASREVRVEFIDALTGTVSAPGTVTTTWNDDGLQLNFKVPERVNGAGNDPPTHLAYIAVRSLA
ncbi:hypothetical protein [Paraburkholderia phenoliruptrix]|uniref:hypothetical protein n=1 Tax=Paraburkholderia phenoliruptrix TaxID=252970 RepID=UPI001C6E0798|nr:hypothetical protein [Paraburkholderia phenoliruptrix]MBW9102425.1 hypothetical protein [Paraburkholderia phenoliruptrix]MBW9127646.1 hypothetical protein [Paraburkholderia ginsengiterrae]